MTPWSPLVPAPSPSHWSLPLTCSLCMSVPSHDSLVRVCWCVFVCVCVCSAMRVRRQNELTKVQTGSHTDETHSYAQSKESQLNVCLGIEYIFKASRVPMLTCCAVCCRVNGYHTCSCSIQALVLMFTSLIHTSKHFHRDAFIVLSDTVWISDVSISVVWGAESHDWSLTWAEPSGEIEISQLCPISVCVCVCVCVSVCVCVCVCEWCLFTFGYSIVGIVLRRYSQRLT